MGRQVSHFFLGVLIMKLHKLASALAFTALAAASYAAPIPLIGSFSATTTGGFIGGSATCAADGTNGTTVGSQANCQATLTYSGAVQTGLVPTAASIAANPLTNPNNGFPPNIAGLVAGAVGGAGVGGLPTFNSVAWGTGANGGPQSSLVNDHIANNTAVITNGAWVVIDRFTHNNNVITDAGGFMNSVGIFATAHLAAVGGFGFAGLDVPGLNPVLFNETLNAPPCAPPNPNGSVCDDVFTTTPLEGAFQFFTDANGAQYFIEFRFDNGAGGVVLDGGLGKVIYTAEGQSSFVTTSMRIFTVPEPTMLGLFGFALVGVALSRRRKVAA
jgi:PEP-CTERM motif